MRRFWQSGMVARHLPPRRGRLNSTQVDLERGGCLFLYPDSNSKQGGGRLGG
jgi:hypothetical protein